MTGDSYYNIAFDFLKEPIFFLDSKNNIVDANASFKKFLLKRSYVMPRGGLEVFWPSLHELSNDGEYDTFFNIRETQVPVTVSISSLPDSKRIVAVYTHKKGKSDPQVNLHAQRIETLGMLAGGIAHDFNNILTGLLGHVTYLKTILPQTGSHVISLAALEDGAKKASSMTQEILNFSRLESDEKPEIVDLKDLSRRTFNLLRGAISPEFELHCDLPQESLRSLAVEAKIAQVIINLVINARDAVSKGGVIRLKLERMNDHEKLKQAFNTDDLSSKDYACLSVTDNGHGMPKEVQDRIFEPYYSTKKSKGTGLGLSIVNEVVRNYAGVIEIDSEVGKGTTFNIYLPILQEVAEKPLKRAAKEVLKLNGGTENILVVDDEYPVRNVLSLSLEHLGYSVKIAASGAEALELYADPDNKFDLVILDMLMPHLSGDQTFFKLKEIDDAVRVLVISGFASADAVNSILDNGGLGFVQKPFTITELATRIRECFEK